MVQNIAALRFGNPIFDAAWNKDYIKNVQVTLAEVLGVEERAGYYDTTGALLDMIQNHTMQIVGWLAMEKPDSFNDKDIRAAKNAAFNALKIYDEEEVNKYFVRAHTVPVIHLISNHILKNLMSLLIQRTTRLLPANYNLTYLVGKVYLSMFVQVSVWLLNKHVLISSSKLEHLTLVQHKKRKNLFCQF